MDLIGIVVIGGVIGVVAAFRYVVPDEASIARRLARFPRTTLGELAEGVYARVVGRATQLQEVLEAPITGRRCLYYQVHVVEVTDKDTRRILLEERGVPFILDAGSDQAIVDPSDALVDLEDDARSEVDWRSSRGYRERALLGQHPGKVSVNADLRFSEAIIELGDTIAVVGTAVREVDPDGAPTGPYRGEQPTRLRVSGKLLISDRPRATQ